MLAPERRDFLARLECLGPPAALALLASQDRPWGLERRLDLVRRHFQEDLVGPVLLAVLAHQRPLVSRQPLERHLRRATHLLLGRHRLQEVRQGLLGQRDQQGLVALARHLAF